jgi:hypothetical protein
MSGLFYFAKGYQFLGKVGNHNNLVIPNIIVYDKRNENFREPFKTCE